MVATIAVGFEPYDRRSSIDDMGSDSTANIGNRFDGLECWTHEHILEVPETPIGSSAASSASDSDISPYNYLASNTGSDAHPLPTSHTTISADSSADNGGPLRPPQLIGRRCDRSELSVEDQEDHDDHVDAEHSPSPRPPLFIPGARWSPCETSSPPHAQIDAYSDYSDALLREENEIIREDQSIDQSGHRVPYGRRHN